MRNIIGLVVAGVCVLLAVALWRFVTLGQKATAQDEKMTASFVANPANDTALTIRGWNRTELDRILADFLPMYGLSDTSVFRIEAKSNDTFVVTFPGDIQPKLFLFLVNYVRYPKNLDLTNRSIGVLGRVILTAAFGVPSSSLIGKRAVIYVPANDTDYDLVYAQAQSGGVYKIPFTTLIWEATEDARTPAEIAGLLAP